MLRFTEIKLLLYNSQSAKCFKYWAEVVIDLLLIGLFMLVVLSWQSIFYTESAGLSCVVTDQDNFELALSDGRYITSRCLLESVARFLLFYPYFQFLQFLLLIGAQVMWLHVPKVKSKLDLYYDIFRKIYEIEPKFQQNNANIVPTIIIDENNKEVTTLIHDKLMFLITEKSCIAKYYIVKNIANLILTLTFMGINSFWMYAIFHIGVDFSCNLKGGFAPDKFNSFSCNISPFYFFMGYLCLFQMLLFLITIFTAINLLFFANVKRFQSHVHDLFGSGGDRLCGLPGFYDFALYVTMHNKNVKDGGFHIQMIKFVINMHATNTPETQKPEDVTGRDSDNLNEKSDKFLQELCIISGIAESLNMQINLKPYAPDHLYQCIEELLLSESQLNLKVSQNIKKMIFDEIRSNYLYYAYLLTGDVVNNGINDVCNILNTFDRFMKDLENKKIWPNNIVLAAASNLLHVKIIVIKTYSKFNHYVDKIEMFEPYSSLWSGKIAIFSLIYPNYYNLLLPLPTNNPTTLHERERIVNCRDFRKRFINKYQTKAVKYLLNEDVKSHKKTKSFTNFNTIQAAAQRVYDDHFVKTIFPTYKIVSSRFRVSNYKPKEENVFIQDETPVKIIFDRNPQ